MSDEKDTTSDEPTVETKTKSTAKKAPEKKSSSAGGYVVAAGRSIATGGKILDAGSPISAAEVADIEALVKGGYVVKA